MRWAGPRDHGVDTEGDAPGLHLGGEIVPVGEHLGVLGVPVGPVLGCRLQFGLAGIEPTSRRWSSRPARVRTPGRALCSA